MTDLHPTLIPLVRQFERDAKNEPRYRRELEEAAQIYSAHLTSMQETRAAIEAVCRALNLPAPDLPNMPTPPDWLQPAQEAQMEAETGEAPPPDDSPASEQSDESSSTDPSQRLLGKNKAQVEKMFRDWWLDPKHKGLTWTAAEIRLETGWDENTIRRLLKQFTRTGMLELDRRRQSRHHSKGRKAEAYKYRDPRSIAGPTSRPRGEVDSRAIADKATKVPRGKPVTGTGYKSPIEKAMRMIKDQRLQAAVREAAREGWEIVIGRSHVICKPASGQQVSIPGTPSDNRSVDNTLAQLRRAGLELSHG